LTPRNTSGILVVIETQSQTSSNSEEEQEPVIVCLCRGKNERDVQKAIGDGASSVRDLMRCGIGDQCGSCHTFLRGMLAQSAAAQAAVTPCPVCVHEPIAALA
jgi:bacterioferritin-associated ferredoxin